MEWYSSGRIQDNANVNVPVHAESWVILVNECMLFAWTAMEFRTKSNIYDAPF